MPQISPSSDSSLGCPWPRPLSPPVSATVGFKTGPEAFPQPRRTAPDALGGFRPPPTRRARRVRTAVICARDPRDADGGLDLSQVRRPPGFAAHLRRTPR